jgi:chitodextrinase
VAGDGKATVSWVPGKNGPGVAVGYVVTASPGGATCRVTGGTSCTVAGLTNGASYRFTVVAVGASGLASAAAAPTAAVVPTGAPSAPRAVTVSAGNRQVTVSWQAPAATGGSPLAKYTVTTTPGPGVRGVAARSCTTTGLSCVVTGLVNGVEYRVQVVAVNTAGKVSAPGQAPTTVRPSGRPTAPQRVTVTPARSSLTVSWQPANGNGSAVLRYTVTTSPGRGGCTAQGATSCTIRGLDPKTAYRVQVTATNAAGLVSAPAAGSSAIKPKK